MALHKSGYAQSIIVGLALTIVVVGTWLPWVRVNPDRTGEPIPDILLPHMHTGFEWGSGLVLIPLVILLALAFLWSRPIQRYLLLLSGGLWAVTIPLQYIRELSLVGFQSTFVPSIGWYLTVAGGVLIALVGGVTAFRRWRTVGNRSRTISTEKESQNSPGAKEPPTPP